MSTGAAEGISNLSNMPQPHGSGRPVSLPKDIASIEDSELSRLSNSTSGDSSASETPDASGSDSDSSATATPRATRKQGVQVAGTTAAIAADAAARRWLLPIEVAADITPASGDAEEVGYYDDTTSVAIFNPSEITISLVDLIVDGETVRSLELGSPATRSGLPAAWLGSGRFVLEVSASSPVVAARELVGLTSRTASIGVAVSEPGPTHRSAVKVWNTCRCTAMSSRLSAV